MALIAPSLLSGDFGHLADEAQRCQRAGADWLHCDVMDFRFVRNMTFGPPMVAALRRAVSIPLDVHLMMENPAVALEAFAAAGADWLTVHAECADAVHLHRLVTNIRALGCKAGVAINPATPPESLDYLLEELDLALVMGVDPGFGGQQFLSSALRKLAWLSDAAVRRGLSLHRQVDGGVSTSNARQIESAGATVLVAGSAVFSASDMPSVITALRG